MQALQDMIKRTSRDEQETLASFRDTSFEESSFEESSFSRLQFASQEFLKYRVSSIESIQVSSIKHIQVSSVKSHKSHKFLKYQESSFEALFQEIKKLQVSQELKNSRTQVSQRPGLHEFKSLQFLCQVSTQVSRLRSFQIPKYS